MKTIDPSLEQLIAAYQCTAEHNDRLYRIMTGLTAKDTQLHEHRAYVEQHDLGFGDAAFHSMWLRLLDSAARRFGEFHALEIGVFKGQVISLWAMISRCWGFNVRISAISPMEGQPLPGSSLSRWFRKRLDSRFRERLRSGNFYANDDYDDIVRNLFDRFGVCFDDVRLFRSYSTDPKLIHELSDAQYHIVYVDGDHTLQGALHDFRTFGAKVVAGGWLVADDASVFLPGTVFWKGHEPVSRAVEILPKMGFKNVLNIGHNRIYERTEIPVEG